MKLLSGAVLIIARIIYDLAFAIGYIVELLGGVAEWLTEQLERFTDQLEQHVDDIGCLKLEIDDSKKIMLMNSISVIALLSVVVAVIGVLFSVTGLSVAAAVLLLGLIGCHIGIAVFEGRFKRPEKPAEEEK